MEKFALFSVACLASYRVTRMLTRESGPFMILAKLRAIIPGDLMTCFDCASVWTSMVIAFFIFDGVVTAIVSGLAISAVSVVIDEMF